MRQAGCERWPIVEGVRLAAFRELDLALKGGDGLPVSQNGFLFPREVDGHGDDLCDVQYN